ncbi:hypothetical protein [Kordia sp.]|uniref:hypothetical protein n=1 Tax=Kordia sp. TaxID=1965332 RepID=UPI003D2E304F
MLTQLQKNKEQTKTAASTVQGQATESKGFSLEDNRASTTATQLMVKAHGKACGCSNCSGATQMKAKSETSRNASVAQLTCDAGHKHHKNGPCPQSPEGKMLRMQGKHGGGKPHGKKAKARPKKRQKKYDQQALAAVRRRQNGPGPGPGPGGAGGAAGGIAAN